MTKMKKQYSNSLETDRETETLALLSDAKAEEDQDKFRHRYREEYIKRRGRVFSEQNGERYSERLVMPLLKCNSTSSRYVNPLLSIALSTCSLSPPRPPLVFLLLFIK